VYGHFSSRSGSLDQAYVLLFHSLNENLFFGIHIFNSFCVVGDGIKIYVCICYSFTVFKVFMCHFWVWHASVFF